MKKYVLMVFIAMLVVITLPAKTELLNFGYNYYNDWRSVEGAKLSSIGLSITGVYDNNFYFQFNLNYGVDYEVDGTSIDITALDDFTVAGFSTILGVGHNFQFGPVGLIIGGGLFGDFNLSTYTRKTAEYSYTEIKIIETEENYYYLTGGLALGVNIYIKPGENFVVNAGVMAAWNPLTSSFDNVYSTTSSRFKNEAQSQFSANIGIGWSK